jgi:uncharacterized protein (DUF2062 family)
MLITTTVAMLITTVAMLITTTVAMLITTVAMLITTTVAMPITTTVAFYCSFRCHNTTAHSNSQQLTSHSHITLAAALFHLVTEKQSEFEVS